MELQYRILVIEEQQEEKDLIKKVLDDLGYEPDWAKNAKKGLERFLKEHYDLVLSGIEFGPGEMSGLELLEQIRDSNTQVPCILMGDVTAVESSVKAINLGVSGFLVKPVEPKELKDSLIRSIRVHKGRFLQQEVRDYRMENSYHAVIPSTEQSVLQLLERVDNLIALVYPAGTASLPDLKMAIYECLANAIEHGNKNDPEKKIYFEAELKMDRIAVHIKDEGTGFNTQEALEGTQTQGLHRGLRLIRHLVDEISFNFQGNEINLFKIL